LAVALAAALALSGCSWVFTRKPPPSPVQMVAGSPDATPAPARRPVPDCSRSGDAPIFDTMVGGLLAMIAVLPLSFGAVALITEDHRDDTDDNLGEIFLGWGLISAALATPWLLSARTGTRNTRACREAWARLGVPS
jgi:hypothetical protein